MLGNRGKLFSSPFCQVLVVFGQLGWTIEPPHFVDHDGCRHHLLQTDPTVLSALVLDGWLQYVAGQVLHRGTMADLCGLGPALALRASGSHTALEAAMLGAVRCLHWICCA